MHKNSPFSLDEFSSIPAFSLKQASYLRSADCVDLAYYSFLSENPVAIVVFYHGGGIYSNRTYQYVGMCLQRDYNISSYFVDIRGHGYSGGARGDAPSATQVFEDVNSMLTFIKKTFPSNPIYLVGHSSGAGLLLNYSRYEKRRDDLYSGYIFLAPFLGRVGVDRPNSSPFAKKVRIWLFILNRYFYIPYLRHIPAVFFNWNKELLKNDPLIVKSYTYTMSSATTPDNPYLIFEQLEKPCILYIGNQDEQFVPEKVVEFVMHSKNKNVFAEIVPYAKHLSILLMAPELINQAIIKI